MAAMAVRVELAQEIERPVGVVFRFYADDHVRNHPRWDPDIELWLDEDEPIGVGTVIRRRNSRSGTPVDGTMEVVEFERDRAIAVVTHDGPMEIRGRATFDAVAASRTKLTLFAEVPELDEAMQRPMTEAIQRSLRRVKELIELEQ
jgi:hypothetical protein